MEVSLPEILASKIWGARREHGVRKRGREEMREGRRERHEGLGREEGREILEAATKKELEGARTGREQGGKDKGVS